MNKMKFRINFFVKLSLLFHCSFNFSNDLKKKKKTWLAKQMNYLLIICNEILFPKSQKFSSIYMSNFGSQYTIYQGCINC